MFPLESMGETGENVAERWGVSREDQDAFAAESQRRWAEADAADRFADELVPIGEVERDGILGPGPTSEARHAEVRISARRHCDRRERERRERWGQRPS